MRSRLRFGAVAVAALMAALPACSSSSNSGGGGGGGGGTGGTSGTAGSAAQPEARQGGTATYLSNGELRNLEPAAQINSPSVASPVMNAIFDSLYTVDPVTNKLQPRIATSFDSPDGLIWTLKLRPGVKFSDGTPLDAAAVKYSWERFNDPKVGAIGKTTVDQIKSMTVKDPTTLVVTLKSVNQQFFQAIPYDATTWIVSPTAVQKEGEQEFSQHPVGAGPFMLQSRVPNSKTVLVRNPHYWQPGLPKLDKLIIAPNPDAQQALDSITAGQADAVYDGVGLLAQRARDAGLRVNVDYTFQGGANFVFNESKPPFNDPRAREAVTLAIDVNKINQQVFQGAAQVPHTLFQKNSPYYDPKLTFPAPDPKKAQQLFDQLAADGHPLKFTINGVAGSQSSPVSKAIQTQLSKFKNVSVDVKLTDVVTFGIGLYTHTFQMANAGSPTTDPEPMFYYMFHSGEQSNFGQINDPQIDQALEAGRTATTLEGRKAAYENLQKALIANDGMIWIWRIQPITIQSKKATGLYLYGQGSPLFDKFGLTG